MGKYRYKYILLPLILLFLGACGSKSNGPSEANGTETPGSCAQGENSYSESAGECSFSFCAKDTFEFCQKLMDPSSPVCDLQKRNSTIQSFCDQRQSSPNPQEPQSSPEPPAGAPGAVKVFAKYQSNPPQIIKQQHEEKDHYVFGPPMIVQRIENGPDVGGVSITNGETKIIRPEIQCESFEIAGVVNHPGSVDSGLSIVGSSPREDSAGCEETFMKIKQSGILFEVRGSDSRYELITVSVEAR